MKEKLLTRLSRLEREGKVTYNDIKHLTREECENYINVIENGRTTNQKSI